MHDTVIIPSKIIMTDARVPLSYSLSIIAEMLFIVDLIEAS